MGNSFGGLWELMLNLNYQSSCLQLVDWFKLNRIMCKFLLSRDTLFVCFNSGDDSPASDRGEDEPESVTALQSAICGRRDSGWNWWVLFSERSLGNLRKSKWSQIKNSNGNVPERSQYLTFSLAHWDLLLVSFAISLFVQKEIQTLKETRWKVLALQLLKTKKRLSCGKFNTAMQLYIQLLLCF